MDVEGGTLAQIGGGGVVVLWVSEGTCRKYHVIRLLLDVGRGLDDGGLMLCCGS